MACASGTTATPASCVDRLPAIGWSSMRMPARPARIDSATSRRTAMMPPCPVSPSMMTGKRTLRAIQPAIVTPSVIVATPTSASPVYAPTTPLVPTQATAAPAASMSRAWAALGACHPARTRSVRWISGGRGVGGFPAAMEGRLPRTVPPSARVSCPPLTCDGPSRKVPGA
jgi:hypothetical protein